jgi:hypothetical protein
MELEELKELEELTELDLLHKLIAISQGQKKEVEECLKENKEAGTRVRGVMQDIKLIAELIRDKVQERKGISKSKKRKNKLSIIIKKSEDKRRKEKEKLSLVIKKEGE